MIEPSDFQRESYRIDEQIWDALALRADEDVLFLGLAADGAWIARAVEIGSNVAVVAGDEATLARIADLGATPLRGSAAMIPARDESFDAAIAFHYLHEVDPGFHPQIVHELARVGKRVAIVEPSPPADPLGRRIAALYARAKHEAGLFEQYQPLEYWRRLLTVVRAEIGQSLFTFTRVPPKHAVDETISLILEAMTIEEMPEDYLQELRTLARRPDAQLLPLSRIVLIGAPAGESLPAPGGTRFRPDAPVAPEPPPAPAAAIPAPAPPPPAPVPLARPPVPRPPVPELTARPVTVSNEPPRFVPPRVTPAPPAPTFPQAPPAAPQPAFGAPFAVPEDEDEAPFGAGASGETGPPSGFGWAWEPPEGENEEG